MLFSYLLYVNQFGNCWHTQKNIEPKTENCRENAEPHSTCAYHQKASRFSSIAGLTVFSFHIYDAKQIENNASSRTRHAPRLLWTGQRNCNMYVCVCLISRARWHCDSYYIRSTDGCQSRRRRSSRQRTTEKERNDKMIKSSESEAVNSPSHVLFILSNSERWRCLCLSHSMVYVVHLSRANWRASPTYTLMHSPTRCRWFLGAFAAHTKPTETIHMRTDDRTNGGENVARATTIRYAIFRMNLFKSIQNGQPNVAHAIHSLSL